MIEPGDATVFAVAGDFTQTGVATTIELPGLDVVRNRVAGGRIRRPGGASL